MDVFVTIFRLTSLIIYHRSTTTTERWVCRIVICRDVPPRSNISFLPQSIIVSILIIINVELVPVGEKVRSFNYLVCLFGSTFCGSFPYLSTIKIWCSTTQNWSFDGCVVARYIFVRYFHCYSSLFSYIPNWETKYFPRVFY